MAHPDEVKTLANAFTGMGVCEKSLVSILGKWDHDKKKSFRKGTPQFFVEDHRSFERWVDQHIEQLKREFLRFKTATVLWTMHPWERDARLLKDAILDGEKSNNVIIEIACTRTADELLGARRAYHSLYDRSIEEDVAIHVHGSARKLLLALVSAYRYEGPKVNEETAKSEAKTISEALKKTGGNPILDDNVVNILAIRSKLHIKAVFKHIQEDIQANASFIDTVECLTTPPTYFSKVLEAAMADGADENTREGLTRVVVTRADVDMKSIEEEYHSKYGVTLTQRIEATTNGNFKDILLTLIARGEETN